MSTPSPAPGGDSRKDLPRATPAGHHHTSAQLMLCSQVAFFPSGQDQKG